MRSRVKGASVSAEQPSAELFLAGDDILDGPKGEPVSEWTEQTIEDAIDSVNETVDSIDPDGHGPYPFRKTFDRIAELRAAFKGVRFEARNHQQALWSSLGAAADRLAEARDAYRKNCKADQKRAATAIAQLDYEFNSAAYGHSTWPDFWSKVRETRELLKESRFEHRDARDQAWNSFNAVLEQAQAQREAKQREREEFERDSEEHKKQVFWHIDRARPVVGMIADFITFDFLNERHEELKTWSSELRAARDELADRGDKMTGADRKEARDAIADVQEELHAAWDYWKELKQAEREQREEEWRERLTNRRDKLEEIIGRKEEYVAKQEDKIEELEEKLSNAWSDEYVARYEEWIEQAVERRDRARDELRELEEQLADINKKLNR